MLGEAQPKAVTPAEQAPTFEQHAPVRSVQGLGEQVVPKPRNVLVAAVQLLADTSVQTLGEAPEQHAPVHEFGEHTVPAPRKTLGAAQSAAATLEQTPAAVQQAPVWAWAD